MKWSARQAALVTKGRMVEGKPGRRAGGISTDTRTMRPGHAFIALEGERFDGHDFVERAANKGASWVMVNRGFPRPLLGTTVIEVDDTLEALGRLARACRGRFRVKVAAVTGSVGKSTTKEMIACLLASQGRVLKNEGNLNNLIGLPLTLFRLNASHQYAVLEMGCNQPGEIERLVQIAEPDAGLITAVAPVHLQGLGSLSKVAEAKAEMIRGLKSHAAFILNLDDPLIKAHARRFKGRVIGFSAKRDAGFKGESLHLFSAEKEVRAGKPMVRFWIQRRKNRKDLGKKVEFYLGTLSRHDAINALAACAMGRAFGVSLEEAAQRLRGFKGLSRRGEVIRSRKGVFIMNDTYNANPASVRNALETLAWWKGPMRGVAVLGEMMELGRYAEKYHREAGRRAAEAGVELLVARGPHAREIKEGALEAGMPRNSVLVVADNGQAGRVLKQRLKKGDWVLVKGSRAMGMEVVAESLIR